MSENTAEKFYYIFLSAFQDNPVELLKFLKKKLGRKIVMYMAGFSGDPFSRKHFSKVIQGMAQLTVYQVLRVRYSYCVCRLIAAEFGAKGVRPWLFRNNRILAEETPISALRHRYPSDLSIVLRAAMASIGAANGVYQ